LRLIIWTSQNVSLAFFFPSLYTEDPAAIQAQPSDSAYGDSGIVGAERLGVSPPKPACFFILFGVRRCHSKTPTHSP
jgi:hypothetical protein